MHVLVVIGFYPPDHSGAGLRISRTYQDLAQRYGVTFQVVAEPVRGGKPYTELDNVVRVKSAQNAFLLIAKLAWLLFKTKSSVDLVHCIGPTRTTVAAAFLCKLMRIPYVTEMSIEYDVDASTRFLLRPFFLPSRAIALTPRIAEVYKRFGMVSERIFTRPNPVLLGQNGHRDSSDDQELLGLIQKLQVKYKHLVFGRLCLRKNQEQALEILNQLPPDHGLILTGPLVSEEDHDYFQILSESIKKNGLTQRVVLWPKNVHAPERIYALVDSLWCVSTLEGLPNVVLEALWMGRLCFVNNTLGLGGWLITERNGAEVDLGNLREAASIIQDKMQGDYDPADIQGESRALFDPIALNDKTMALFKAACRRE